MRRRNAGNVLVHVEDTREWVGAVAFAADVADRWQAQLEAVAAGARRGSKATGQAYRQRLADALSGTPIGTPALRCTRPSCGGTRPRRSCSDPAGGSG